MLSHLVEGFLIAVIFALAHIVEETQFPLPDKDGYVNTNWAIHQMYTTADFGRRSTLTRFFTGGLNFQIEHHLFPEICHVHYPAISELVREKALEFNLPYNDNTTFWSAVKSHTRLLKKLGAVDV
ncbi:MAG: fatty acid desaturase [Cytophagaceae bacterium]